MYMNRQAVLMAPLLLFAGACDEGSTAEPPTLTMQEQALEAVGDSVQLQVLEGETPLPATFTSLDPDIVVVSESGMARATSAGTARIEAMVGKHSIAGEVTVLPPADVRIWLTELEPAGDGEEKLTLRILNVGGRGFYRLELYRRGEGGTAIPVRVDLNDNPAPGTV